jgi:beta-galactosidase
MGDQLPKAEGYTGEAEAAIHEILSAAKVHGLDYLPREYDEKLRICEEKYGANWAEISRLYGKYIGGWGDKSMRWRVDGIKNGEIVSSVDIVPNTALHLDVKVSKTHLNEGSTYDMAAIRIRLLDEYDNPAEYAQLPVIFSLEGEAELIGPNVVTAEGGMCGTYIRTIGSSGKAKLTIATTQTKPVEIEFTVK